jgi:hypothetical protein
VEGSCEYGSEHLGSIKCWKILDQLSDWWLLKKNSAISSYYSGVLLRLCALILRNHRLHSSTYFRLAVRLNRKPLKVDGTGHAIFASYYLYSCSSYECYS